MATPWWMVVLLGMGIVFLGLSLMVLLCNLLRIVFAGVKDSKPETQPAAVAQQPAAAQPAVADRKKLLAIASAVIAEAEGVNAPGFKIVSFERR
ncbi:MAG: OadG family protein [Bacillota bacterium]|nr:OadG family protein [Bacillota bacterium]